MKILDVKQIKALDAYTITQEPIASIELMERACQAIVTWFTERFHGGFKVGVVCGTGNNGGDGLGVARLLAEWGYTVSVWIVRGEGTVSADFNTNLERLGANISIQDITTEVDTLSDALNRCDILFDAVFGSGLSRPLTGIYAHVIQALDSAHAIKVAIDIPSGVMADVVTEGPAVCVDYTLTFQLPKLAFLLPDTAQYVGDWHVLDIGLNGDFIASASTGYELLQLSDIRGIQKKRSRFDHKGVYGRALLIAGSEGKVGAAVLAARAALRTGVGLLTVHAPRVGYTVLQTAVPEAMVDQDVHETVCVTLPSLEKMDGIGIGPGLGQAPETVAMYAQLLQESPHPLVIDADGLNILASHSALLSLLPAGSVLTPHVGEFRRLVGDWSDDFEKLQRLRRFAHDHQVVVVLKGAFSAVAAPDEAIYFNATGNPGMATGGSGDVLTGILTSLLAQGYESVAAACYGVYLHGLAGDLAVREKGMEALIASDLVDFLPQAFKRLAC